MRGARPMRSRPSAGRGARRERTHRASICCSPPRGCPPADHSLAQSGSSRRRHPLLACYGVPLAGARRDRQVLADVEPGEDAATSGPTRRHRRSRMPTTSTVHVDRCALRIGIVPEIARSVVFLRARWARSATRPRHAIGDRGALRSCRTRRSHRRLEQADVSPLRLPRSHTSAPR